MAPPLITLRFFLLAALVCTPLLVSAEKSDLAADGKWLYKVGFADSDQVDVKQYFGESPPEPKFSSVKEYAEIFGR